MAQPRPGLVMLAPIVRLVMEQSPNAYSPMLVTLLPIMTFCML
jgi:hypothetical protein